jgi:cobalamin synthase
VIGLPDLAAAALALGASAILTGALHEDGLADVADGFGGGRDPAAKLEIMRDSRLGTYGALILMVSFVAKLSALAALPDAVVVQSLIATHALARGVLPMMAASLPCAPGWTCRQCGQARFPHCRNRGRICACHRLAVAAVDRGAGRRAGGGGVRDRHGAAGAAANRRPDRRRARRHRAAR